ncbi:MAG: hypothetical protein WA777_13600 [Rhodanobacter sp.]
MNTFHRFRISRYMLLISALLAVTVIYWPGLSGSWLFDDYPNIVDNMGVQPADTSLSSLVNAALSSPASEFKRPLASLSFAANYLTTGLDPFWMKLTNLLIHLLNGMLVFLLARLLLRSTLAKAPPSVPPLQAWKEEQRIDNVSALIAAGWMLLPINLTAVLYVVQRMESMANLFVLLGLIGYVTGRRRMLRSAPHFLATSPTNTGNTTSGRLVWRDFWLCLASLILPTAVGVLAKETAIMLPLYAALIEWILFRFHNPVGKRDWRIIGTFMIVLVLPMMIGLAWLLPGLLNPGAWATRDFTLSTRLLSEARIVTDYIDWTLLPTSHALSFYHDDFDISTGLLAPWTTLTSMLALAALITLMIWLRRSRPLIALGIALFLGCQLLTATILPLELIYEHRNYFASFGLLLASIPLLAGFGDISSGAVSGHTHHGHTLLCRTILGGLLLFWALHTAITAIAWGDPLRLAQELAARAPESPRAQYELGRTCIIYSHYDPASPFTQQAYAPLEKAASLSRSSILPQQALIFMNSRMHLPLKDAWWDSMIAKLRARPPGVQDESSLGALTQCARENQCDLSKERMTAAFQAALSHPNPTARLQATYGDYAWNVLGDRALGERMIVDAVRNAPNEAAYRITLIRMLLALRRPTDAASTFQSLQALNVGGRLNNDLRTLHQQIAAASQADNHGTP